MTRSNRLDELSDAELIRRTRAGEMDAYGVLFQRHEADARRTAAWASAHIPSNAEDLLSQAYLKVLELLRSSATGGPTDSFLPYVRAVIRNEAIALGARMSDSSGLPEDLGDPVALDFDDVLAEQSIVREAFATLPAHWRQVLWNVEVESQKPGEIARNMRMQPAAVSAMLYRAREKFKDSYLQAHIRVIGDTEAPCKATQAKLGAFVRGSLSPRQELQVQGHVASCRLCRALVGDLRVVGRNLAAILPVAAAAGTVQLVASGASAGASAPGTISTSGVGTAKVMTASFGAVAVVGGIITAAVAIHPATPMLRATVDASPSTSALPGIEVPASGDPAPPSTLPIPESTPDLVPEQSLITADPDLSYVLPADIPEVCASTWVALVTAAGERLHAVNVVGDGANGEISGAHWVLQRADGAVVGFSDVATVNDCGPWWQKLETSRQ